MQTAVQQKGRLVGTASSTGTEPADAAQVEELSRGLMPFELDGADRSHRIAEAELMVEEVGALAQVAVVEGVVAQQARCDRVRALDA